MLLQYKRVLSKKSKQTLIKKCLYLEYSDPNFTCNLTEYGEMWTISRYSVRMLENKDQKSSEYQNLSRSDAKHNNHENGRTNESFEALLRWFL